MVHVQLCSAFRVVVIGRAPMLAGTPSRGGTPTSRESGFSIIEEVVPRETLGFLEVSRASLRFRPAIQLQHRPRVRDLLFVPDATDCRRVEARLPGDLCRLGTDPIQEGREIHGKKIAQPQVIRQGETASALAVATAQG